MIKIEDPSQFGGAFDGAAGVAKPFVRFDESIANTLVRSSMIVELVIALGDVGKCAVALSGPNKVSLPRAPQY